jgi:hypothetical protein
MLPWVEDRIVSTPKELRQPSNDTLLGKTPPVNAPTVFGASTSGNRLLGYRRLTIGYAFSSNTACIMVTTSSWKAVEAERGYVDIRPEHLWEKWQQARKYLGQTD